MKNVTNKDPSDEPRETVVKKLYKVPSLRFQRVFETMALSCGKVDPTQGSCHSNRKVS